MQQNQTNPLQGTLDLLILQAIGEGELHGLGIARRIEQVTQARTEWSRYRPACQPFSARRCSLKALALTDS
jgi:hypothetical protein